MTMQLRDYQLEAIEKTASAISKYKRVCLTAATGCHAPDSRIILADGSVKKARDIKVGDKLIGPDGKPRTVICLHHGREEMVEVSSPKIDSFVVNKGHIMALYLTPKKKGDAPRFVELPVSEWDKQHKTFRHMAYLYRRGNPCEFISNVAAPDNHCSPYLLGAYLADGSYCKTSNVIALHKRFKSWFEIVKKEASFLLKEGYETKRFQDKNRPLRAYITVTRGSNGKGKKDGNAWVNFLLTSSDGNIKKVPDWVKYGSVQTRREYLAGVLDGDGHCSGNTHEITLRTKSQIEDLRFIALSLGLCVSKIAIKKVKLSGWSEAKEYFRIHISGDFSDIPLVEKKITEKRQKKNPSLFKPRFKSLGIGEYFGWEVDGDNLYLDADFIVHHNSGKSILIAEIARRFLAKNPSSRVLILCHQSEILSQNESKMKSFGLDDVGIYCAALGRKNTRQRVILASRDSLGRSPLAAGRFEFIIIDEAHLVPIFDPEKDEPQTRYEKIFHAQNPTYLLGLTGSPYRMNGGNIFGKGKLFKEESYRISTKTLQQKGFLAPHSFPRIKELVETKRLKTKGGEFDTEEQAKAFGSDKVVIQAVREWWRLAANRKCSLFFCCSIAHSKRVEEEIKKYTAAVRHVDGELGQKERERLVSDARDGKIKAIVNCAVFTTGVDIPPIDCVVFLRATKSTALFVQMAGRGLRVSPGKNDVLYLDFAGNWERFFQINDPMLLEPDPVFSQMKSGTKDESSDFLAMLGVEDQRQGVMKLCKECGEEVPAATKQCPSCGSLFISHGNKPGEGEKESFDGWRLVRPKSIVIKAHKTQKGGECAKALISLNGKTYVLFLQTTGFYAARDKPLLDFLSKNPAEILMRKNPFNPSFFEAANPKYNQRSLGFLNTSTFSAGATTPKEPMTNEQASTDK